MSGTIDLGLVDGEEFGEVELDLLEGFLSHGGDFGAGNPSGTPADGSSYYDTTAHRLWRYDGTGWVVMAEPAQTFTPAFAGVSLGAGGAVDGKYHRSDGYCDFYARYIMGGAGGGVTGPVILTLPKASSDLVTGQINVTIVDNSVGNYLGSSQADSTTGVICMVVAANNTYANLANIGATAPQPSWATNDRIDVSGRYKMNTRYL